MKVDINSYYSMYGANSELITEKTNERIAELEGSGNEIIDVRVQTSSGRTTVTILYELSDKKIKELLEKPRIQTF